MICRLLFLLEMYLKMMIEEAFCYTILYRPKHRKTAIIGGVLTDLTFRFALS